MVSKYLIGAVFLFTGLNADGIFKEEQGNNEDDYPQFAKWKEIYGKQYGSEEEAINRKSIYEANLRIMKDHNESNKSSYVMGINQFSDLDSDEFANLLSRPRQPSLKKHSFKQSSVMKSELPEKIDWRDHNGFSAVTHVKDQMSCSSCWAFSTTGSVEGAHAIKTKSLLSLSEQQLIDCTYTKLTDNKSCSGCNGGFMDVAFQYIIDNGGITTEDEYPYTAGVYSAIADINSNFYYTHGTCEKTKEMSHSAKISGFTNVTQYDENALMQAVANQPVSVGVNGSDWMYYKSGVYDGTVNGVAYKYRGCGNVINHGVLVVGYTKDYWIVKNSWNTTWGEEGYIRLKRNVNCEKYPKFCNKSGTKNYGMCGILENARYPLIEDEPNEMHYFLFLFFASAIALFVICILCRNLEVQEEKEVPINVQE